MAALDLGDLGFKIKVDTTEFDSALSKIESKARGLDKTLEGTGKRKISVKADSGSLSKVESAAKAAGSAVDAVNGKRVSPQADSGQLDKVATAAKSAGDAIDSASGKRVSPSADTGQLGKVESAAKSASDEVEKLSGKRATPVVDSSPLEQVAAKSRDAASATEELAHSANPLGGMFSSAASSAAGMMGALAGVGGVASAFGKIMSTGMEFQSSMNTMSAVSGATGEQLAAVSAKARELGTDASLTATSATDASQAMTELAKGGFTVEQSMSAAKGTLQLAAAAGVEAADAATIQSQALQAFSLGAGDAARVSDILAGAANASSAEMTGIAQGLQQSGTVAHQFGLSIEDTATSLAMLANAGIQGSDAGTLLKTTLLSVTDQGKPAQEAIEKLGLTVYDSNGKFVGMASLLEQLKMASKAMTDEQYQAATATLFGSDAMRLSGIAAQQGAQGFNTLKEAVTRQGQAAEVAAAQTQGLPGVWERFENTMEDLWLGMFDNMDDQLFSVGNSAVDMVEGVAPALEKMAHLTGDAMKLSVDGVAKAVEVWGKLPGPVKEVATSMALVAAAVKSYSKFSMVSTAVDGLTSAFKRTRGGISDFTSAFGEAYSYARQANPELSRTGAALQVLGGKGGVAAAGMGKLKGAAAGVLDMLGGPWGVAFAAAGAAVASAVDYVQAADQAEKNLAESSVKAAKAHDQLAASIAGTKGALSGDGLAAAVDMANAKLTEFEERGKLASKWQSSFIEKGAYREEDYQRHLKEETYAGSSADSNARRKATEDAKNGYKELQSAMEELKMSKEDVDKAIAVGGESYDNLISHLRSTGDSGNWAADRLAESRTSMQQAIDAARQLDPSAAQAAAGIEVLADSSASADDKLSALKSTMQAMGLLSQTADQAMMEMADTVEEIGNSVSSLGQGTDGLGDKLFDGDNLNVQNDNARQLSSTLSDMSDQLMNVGVAGGDVNEAWDTMIPVLDNIRAQMGLTGEEFDAQWSHILESYGLAPDVVHTLVELDGASEAVQSLGDLWAGLYKVEEGATIPIDPPNPDVVAVMDELGIKYEEIKNASGETIQFKVTAPSDEVKGQLDEITTKMAEIDDESITIEAIMDPTQVEMGAAEVESLLQDLDIKNPSPQAQLVIDDLKANHSIAMGDLEYLNQQSANPVADLDKLLLDNGINTAHGQLDGLNAHSTNSKVDADTSSFTSKVGSAINLINSIPLTKRITFIGEVVGSAWNRIRGNANGGIAGFATGGELPRLAIGGDAGYRLPTSGPGTNMVDGFLGVDGSGMPIARVDAGEWVINRRSSAQFGATLAALNAGNAQQALMALLQSLPAHADGGVTKSEQVKEALAPFNNGPYVMGGFSPSAFDCSGAVAAGVNAYLGLDPFDSRMSTVNEGQWLAAKGFENGPGNGKELVVAWYDYGGGANGHTAMMLPDGTYIESGGNTGQGMTIGGAAGPLEGRGFTNFMYLPGSDSDSGELTGDLGETDGFGTALDVAGASAKSRPKATALKASKPQAGSMYHVPGFASNVPGATVGSALGGHRGAVQGAANRAGVGAQAAGVMNWSNPFVGSNSFRDEIGEPGSKQILSIAKQLEKQFGQKGIAAQVEAALSAKTPNWDVWLRVNEDTIDAFNRLEEAKADVKNNVNDVAEAEEKLADLKKKAKDSEGDAADKLTEAYKALDEAKSKELTKSYTQQDKTEDIEKAQKKIDDLRKKSGDNANKTSQQIADAEQEIINARNEEKEKLRELKEAQLAYNTALQMAPIKAVASLTDKIAEGFGAIAENMELMAANMDHANELIDARQSSELDDVNAKQDALDAARKLRQLERDSSNERHKEVLDQQQAEFDLAIARHDYNSQYSDLEVNLAELRTKGILDVSQRAMDTDRLAMISASGVAVAEKQLELTRAQAAKGEFERQVALQEATYEVNFQEEMARIQHERLAVATQELADAAAAAAGKLGGSASALAQETQGKQKKAAGAAGVIGGIAQLFGAIGMTIATGGAALPAALALGAAGLKTAVEGGKNIAEGKAQADAYKKQAKEEYDALSADDKRRVDTARAGLVVGAIAGGAVGLAGGSSDDVANMFDATSGIFNLPLYQKQMTQKYGAEAAALMTAKKKAELDRQEKAAQLERAKAAFDLSDSTAKQADALADMQDTLQKQLNELQQENKQLAGIDDKIGDKNKSVLMSIGGSGWGVNSTDGMMLGASTGGFGGVTRDEVGAWSSLNVENGWNTADIMRPLVDSVKDTAADAAASRGIIEGLPETVAEGRYAKLLAEESVVPGALDAAGRSVLEAQREASNAAYEAAAKRVLAEMSNGSTTNIGTQFTGAVSVNAKLEDTVLDGLRSMAANK
ncbi:phage tail tape measure protein [Corynebacterium striatum]